MIITKQKKLNVVQIEVRDTVATWLVNPVSTIEEVEANLPTNANLLLVNLQSPLTTIEDISKWDYFSQQLKKEKNLVLIYTPGEYRVMDIHMRGSNLDASTVHYVLETPDGSVGIFQQTPSDNFIKSYAPIDVVIGRDVAVAGVQIDLEPFAVVLPSVSDEYRTKSGVTDIKETEKVNIKKIDPMDREGTVTMTVYSLL